MCKVSAKMCSRCGGLPRYSSKAANSAALKLVDEQDATVCPTQHLAAHGVVDWRPWLPALHILLAHHPTSARQGAIPDRMTSKLTAVRGNRVIEAAARTVQW